jgi:hypothetical protein
MDSQASCAWSKGVAMPIGSILASTAWFTARHAAWGVAGVLFCLFEAMMHPFLLSWRFLRFRFSGYSAL